MGCFPRFLITLAAMFVLLGVPATTQAVDVYRYPVIPGPEVNETGSVLVSIAVWKDERWVIVDGLLTVPGGLPVECSALPERES